MVHIACCSLASQGIQVSGKYDKKEVRTCKRLLLVQKYHMIAAAIIAEEIIAMQLVQQLVTLTDTAWQQILLRVRCIYLDTVCYERSGHSGF